MRLKKSKENLRAQLPYKRTQRVGEQIQEILGEIALKYIDLSPFGFVTFTNVDLSPDFHLAKVYFSVYQPKKEIQDIERELNRLTKAFKKKLVDGLLDHNNCKLSKDAYWFFLENSSNDYQIIENEIIKIHSLLISIKYLINYNLCPKLRKL